MRDYKKFWQIITSYVEDYNNTLNKKLLIDDDFFGDTIRLIDFLNKYYKLISNSKDVNKINAIKENVNTIRECFTGLNQKEEELFKTNINLDTYRQAKKGVHKVRKLIPSVSEKKEIIDSLVDSYNIFNDKFKNQEFLVYTNNSLYSFELKEDYFPHVIGLSLEDNVEEQSDLSEKEISYYKNLPNMLNKLNNLASLESLDKYEHDNYHSLFNYSYLKVKNTCFRNFYYNKLPMFVYHNIKKENSNIKTNTYLLKPIILENETSFASIAFHENSKFNFGYAESNIEFGDKLKINGEYGITTALFKKDKIIGPRNFNLVRMYTINEQIKFIDMIEKDIKDSKITKELKDYQNRLKRSLFDYINLECCIINK